MAATVTGDNVDLGGGVVIRVKELTGATGGLDTTSQNHKAVWDVWRPGRQAVTMAQLYEAVTARVPPTFLGMSANTIEYREEDDTDHWLFTIGYNIAAPEATIRWAFDTSGGTVRMFTSKATQSYPAPSRTAPDFKGAIGVKISGGGSGGGGAEPEGVDIVTPVLKLTATYRHPKNTIDFAYVKAIAALTGKTNNSAFYTFDQGELLFLGATGELVPDIPTEIRYEFAASSNVTGLTLGTIAGIAKKGHEYLWTVFEPEQDTSAKKLVQRPLAAYVERVYDEGDFADLSIGTA